MSQKNYAIILAGGTGLRMSVDIPKQFLTIDKLPIIVRTLNVFQNHDKIDGIIVVVYPEYIDRVKQYANEYSLTKILNIVAGGETRQISSYNGLHAWDFKDDDIIIFHDAVRPFLTNEIINDCISGVLEIGAVDVCVKTTDTIVESSNDNTILSLPDRTNLRNGQTPQAFTYKLILDAHENAKKNNFTQTTDDVRLVHNLGHPVKIIEGNYENIKITNPQDVILSEVIAQKYKNNNTYSSKIDTRSPLSKKMYNIGYTTGVFDLFHIGHLNILRKAKENCDYLIVGVSTDELVQNYKNKSPIIPYCERKTIIEAIQYVDKVVPQGNRDKIEAHSHLKFDVMFVGDDWKESSLFIETEKQFKEMGVDIIYFPYTTGTSSTLIKNVLHKLMK